MKENGIPIEKILEKINIQSNLIDLQSGNREKVRSALNALAGVTLLSKRKDSLYALVGYYVMEVKTLEQIEFFFKETKSIRSPDLAYLILKDLTQFKEASKHRLLINDFLNHLSDIQVLKTSIGIEPFIQLVEHAEWGEKQKRRFIEELYEF
jgi:hypothetical protein